MPDRALEAVGGLVDGVVEPLLAVGDGLDEGGEVGEAGGFRCQREHRAEPPEAVLAAVPGLAAV